MYKHLCARARRWAERETLAQAELRLLAAPLVFPQQSCSLRTELLFVSFRAQKAFEPGFRERWPFRYQHAFIEQVVS